MPSTSTRFYFPRLVGGYVDVLVVLGTDGFLKRPAVGPINLGGRGVESRPQLTKV